jgi:hypothetical protein
MNSKFMRIPEKCVGSNQLTEKGNATGIFHHGNGSMNQLLLGHLSTFNEESRGLKQLMGLDASWCSHIVC